MARLERLDGIDLTGLVPELRGEAPPTFRCRECLDTGYLHRDTDAGPLASACFCDLGTRIEAGRWFERTYPLVDGSRRVPRADQIAALDDLVTRHGIQAEDIRDAVRDLLKQYNSRMRRVIHE